MEKTILINGNGNTFEREVPLVRVFGFKNEVATENLRKQTGIDFQHKNNYLEGQPQTWEQFSKIFLAYDFLSHSINNYEGNIMILRADCNVPLNSSLYYFKDGQRFLGVE